MAGAAGTVLPFLRRHWRCVLPLSRVVQDVRAGEPAHLRKGPMPECGHGRRREPLPRRRCHQEDEEAVPAVDVLGEVMNCWSVAR